ncbi:MAG: hypothetical protein RM338_18040 [Nostoc sp. DedQUE12a]|nr:hypothetical protein [Nostoc sp. DedQUE12a]
MQGVLPIGMIRSGDRPITHNATLKYPGLARPWTSQFQQGYLKDFLQKRLS